MKSLSFFLAISIFLLFSSLLTAQNIDDFLARKRKSDSLSAIRSAMVKKERERKRKLNQMKFQENNPNQKDTLFIVFKNDSVMKKNIVVHYQDYFNYTNKVYFFRMLNSQFYDIIFQMFLHINYNHTDKKYCNNCHTEIFKKESEINAEKLFVYDGTFDNHILLISKLKKENQWVYISLDTDSRGYYFDGVIGIKQYPRDEFYKNIEN